MARNLFSVDLEDWFHILDTHAAPPLEAWPRLESRVVANTRETLEALGRHDVRATFFVLGWIAERYPELVREVAAAGHEIASHGHRHVLVYRQTPQEFRRDIREASDAIHAACGVRPEGYRAPGFSITREALWAFDVLRDEGYVYDSSLFPARRGHGGLPGATTVPSILPNGLREIPISTLSLGPGRLAYLGGGYLRAIPSGIVTRMARRQSEAGTPLVLYMHPRDIDAGQPRLPLGPYRRFKTYVGLATCLRKVQTLLRSFPWGPFGEYEWPSA